MNYDKGKWNNVTIIYKRSQNKSGRMILYFMCPRQDLNSQPYAWKVELLPIRLLQHNCIVFGWYYYNIFSQGHFNWPLCQSKNSYFKQGKVSITWTNNKSEWCWAARLLSTTVVCKFLYPRIHVQSTLASTCTKLWQDGDYVKVQHTKGNPF